MAQQIRPRNDDKPVQLENGDWTVPEGYKVPSCPGCGHRFYEMEPQLSKGGASVHTDFYCRWCNDELMKDMA